jgi:hypothetical protein
MLLIQEHVKEEYVVHCVTAIYIFPFQLVITHMLWVSARMFIQEKELRNYAHAFEFQSAY